jgi:tetratricopeptide (TPR) repeat protein
MKLKQLIFTAIFIVLCISVGFAQTDREKGIELFNKGDFQGAVEVLSQVVKSNETDVIALYNLGLAYEKLNQNKDAIKSFENVISICESIIVKTVEEFYGDINGYNNQVVFNNAVQKYDKDLESGYLAIIRFVSLKPKDANSSGWRKKIETIEAFAPNSEIAKSIVSEKDLTTKPKILTMPHIEHGSGYQGTARFRVLLIGNGKIGAVISLGSHKGLNSLGYDTTKKLRFTPATKDGKPVSVWKTIEYRVSIN